MTLSPRILRAGAIGAGISTLMLLMMAFISLPRGVEYPGIEVLTGGLILPEAEKIRYIAGISHLFIMDGFFLVGWIISWVGLAELIRPRYRILAVLTLTFGLTGAMFDLIENSIIWGVIGNFAAGRPSGSKWVIPWKALQSLSYWLPFLGAVFAACGLWSARRLDKITALTGSVLLLAAIPGLYLPDFAFLANMWFLFWFACVALLLWRRSVDIFKNS
ncbi:MAG: hypothetical protein JEZ04_12455 [Spirochaetales bacterium]|nr:hypothetical protein [Spirochaetales bacterium]